MTTDFMNSGKEYVACQTLGILLDICPTFHILGVTSEFRCVLFYAECLTTFDELRKLEYSRNVINFVTWKYDVLVIRS
jgi:hypothetical protein